MRSSALRTLSPSTALSQWRTSARQRRLRSRRCDARDEPRRQAAAIAHDAANVDAPVAAAEADDRYQPQPLRYRQRPTWNPPPRTALLRSRT
jgi:hypothetical protein